MCVEYVFVNNAPFFVSIVATSTNHQFKLPIYRFEALTKGFQAFLYEKLLHS